MRNERSENYVEDALRELAASLGRTQAPTRVEAELRAAFRQKVAARAKRGTWVRFAALPVAAALLLALGLAVVRRSPEPQAARPARAAAREIVTDFFPLSYGPSPAPEGHLQIVRVRLPRSAMASFGLPLNPDGDQQRIQADVVLGSDGLARAIRFVR